MFKQFAFVASSVLVVAACAGDQGPGALSPSTTSGSVQDLRIANPEAIAQLTNARCNRDERCGLIGPGKKYADRAACETEVKKDTTVGFGAAECKGVKNSLLTECASDVTKLACSIEKPEVMMVTSCRGEELCR